MGRLAFIGGHGGWVGGRRASAPVEAGAGTVAPPPVRLPWLQIHNGALQFQTALQGSGTLVKLAVLGSSGTFHGGRRGVVGNTPSKGSALRFRRAMAEIPWESLPAEDIYCGNVTYHGIPRDGRAVRRDVKAFERRLDRAFGRRGVGYAMTWVKEFQKRGSWHLHFVLYVPLYQVAVEHRGVYDVVRDSWLGVIGEQDDMNAYLHGVECSRVQNIRAVKNYECKYMGKRARGGAKAYEKVQPAWFKGGGRWWGVVGRRLLAPSYRAVMLHTWGQYVEARRLLRGYIRSVTHGHYVPKVFGAHSMSIVGYGRDYGLLTDVIRWVVGQSCMVGV